MNSNDTMPAQNRRQGLRSLLALPVGLAAAGAVAGNAVAKSDTDVLSRLDRLESQHQISELLLAYARANDRFDEAALRACFWPESTHKHGGFDGTSTAFVDFALKIVQPLKYTAHHISNVSVEVDGDRGFSECYYLAQHRRTAKSGEGEEDAFFQGRYIDRHERRNGVWKIIQRRGISDLSFVLPATKPYADWPAGQHSARAPDDPYYQLRALFQSGR